MIDGAKRLGTLGPHVGRLGLATPFLRLSLWVFWEDPEQFGRNEPKIQNTR